jgi:hypothetical protein
MPNSHTEEAPQQNDLGLTIDQRLFVSMQAAQFRSMDRAGLEKLALEQLSDQFVKSNAVVHLMGLMEEQRLGWLSMRDWLIELEIRSKGMTSCLELFKEALDGAGLNIGTITMMCDESTRTTTAIGNMIKRLAEGE